jgi:hypothetical protein
LGEKAVPDVAAGGCAATSPQIKTCVRLEG